MSQPALIPEKTSHYRWMVCFLLFLATTVNYMDRSVISILKPTLAKDLGWDEIDYGYIVISFQLAYAFGLLLMGRLMDRVGVRRGLIIAVSFWSMAALSHGFMGHLKVFGTLHLGVGNFIIWTVPATVLGFCCARFVLGLAEGGNFPAAIKCVSEWFPKKERALATGLFNAGSNVGAIITPLLVPFVTLYLGFGWPAAFFTTAAFDICWLILWWTLYDGPDRHPRVSANELAYIRSDPIEPVVKIAWLSLLKYRQTWAFTIAKFMTDPIWWFYLFWTPDFLCKRFNLTLADFWGPFVVIYVMADVGSIGGGWISSALIKRGFSVNFGRKIALLICALCVVPIFFASQVQHMWTAVFLIGLAASAHQGFSANLFTFASDTMPRHTVSTVVGIGGMAGAFGGMGFAGFVSHVLEWTKSYYAPFAIASLVYLLALLIIQILVPRIKQ
jgi:ACS family hexuronate transporter-like MFS transporter